MAKRKRHPGRWIALGVAVVVVAVAAIIWTTNSANASRASYITATAAMGDVTQPFNATGTVARSGVDTASFQANGTVSSVKVGIGDTVKKGDVLATIDATSLKIALLNAEASQAQAEASLYSAQHPTSGSSGLGSSYAGSGYTGNTGSGNGGSGSNASNSGASSMSAAQIAAALAAANQNSSSSASSSKGSSSKGSAGSSMPTGAASASSGYSAQQISQLLAAVAAVMRAEAAWSSTGVPGAKLTTCDRVYQGLGITESSPSPTPSPSPTQTSAPTTDQPTTEPTNQPTTEPTDQATTEPTTEPTTTSTDQATTSTTEQSASAFATVTADDVTTQDIVQCGKDRTALAMASVKLSVVYNQLITAKPGASASSRPSASTAASSSTSKSPSSVSSAKSSTAKTSSTKTSSTPTVSKSAVARAQASLLQAEQAAAIAQTNVNDTTLTAPEAGTVGALSLTAGQSSSGGSVTIVGSGDATVSFEVPLTTRKLISLGQSVSVVPTGSEKTLTGTITQINILETSGTAGDSPTYTTSATIPDPSGLLIDGSRATVQLQVITSTNVVTVPVSAVTPTGTNTGTVSVLSSTDPSSARMVEVTTGAVGDGLVEIAKGVTAGDVVVLANANAALPSNNSLTGIANAAGAGGGGMGGGAGQTVRRTTTTRTGG